MVAPRNVLAAWFDRAQFACVLVLARMMVRRGGLLLA
jgi:hypothetical protein